jgi:hypothetical protein
MKAMSRVMTMTLSAAAFASLFVSNASAGCGDPSNLQDPFVFPQPLAVGSSTPHALPLDRDYTTASIVGLWKFQFLSLGNTTHNPSIPDGALIDFGYSEWHSDATEIMNSGTHAPATQNFCLGTWRQTGVLTYELNHFALSYDATSGALTNRVNIRETITLDPAGATYTGTFTIQISDSTGTVQVDHLAGTVSGTLITVDSTLP